MKVKLLSTLLVTLSLVLVVPAHAGLLEQSAAMDRSYVPALALTNQRDKPQILVGESVQRFVTAWEKFSAEMNASEETKNIFSEAIALCSPKVAEAAKLAGADKRKEAHEALETVRLTLWKARGSRGIVYLPDLFTAFHEPMEEFAETAAKPDADVAQLKKEAANLSKQWKNIEDTALDSSLFRVGPERAKKYDEQVKKQREILDQIEQALVAGEREKLSKATMQMKGNFAQTFFVFGDFSGL